LRVAAELAVARSSAALADLVDELGMETRLDVLDAGGDSRAALRTVFSWSYHALAGGADRAFRMIGLHPGQDFDAYAVAALMDDTPARSAQLLRALSRAYLIQSRGATRYGMHDLLHSYARELAADEGEAARRTAVTRLFDYYLYVASAAVNALTPAGESRSPAEESRQPRIPLPATPVPVLASENSARAWLDAELVNLTMTAAFTSDHGWLRHCGALSNLLFRYLGVGAFALNDLERIFLQEGGYQEAEDHIQQGLIVSREAGDHRRETEALNTLGEFYFATGRPDRACKQHLAALSLAGQTCNQHEQARAYRGLGNAYHAQRDTARTRRHWQEAIAIYAELEMPEADHIRVRLDAQNFCLTQVSSNLGGYGRQRLLDEKVTAVDDGLAEAFRGFAAPGSHHRLGGIGICRTGESMDGSWKRRALAV
jgi:tetratricopeptide (TPR) repeat protein